MNKLRKAYFIGLFALLLLPLSSAVAAESTRYFVKSSSQFWKNAFNARHEFKDGFTANLNDWQIRFAKILGVAVEPVGILQILPLEEIKAPKTSPKPRPTPSDQISWGIESVYGSSEMTSTSGGEGIKVAVIDTGIAEHPDLKSRLIKCKDFTNARFPVVNGKCEDKNGHGTHVAGIVAADGGSDGLGIYGMAPAAVLYAFKSCALNGTCYADDLAVAVQTAADDGANIINLSVGSDRSSVLINEAIDYAISKGVLVVTAAGNDGPYAESIDYPAAKANVVAVAAFDSFFKIADWSSRGVNTKTTPLIIEEKDIELAAPGVNIESTWSNGGYAVLSGTSMATPFVSGLAAKIWTTLPLDTEHPAQTIRELLQKNTMDLDVIGEDDSSGLGFSKVQQ